MQFPDLTSIPRYNFSSFKTAFKSINHLLTVYCSCSYANKYWYGWDHEFNTTKCWIFFCWYIFFKKMLVNIIIIILSQEYQNFLISKHKKFLPHAGFEPGSLLNLSMHGTPYRISLVGIPKHVVATISAFSFIMLLLDRILTHIVNHLSNTSYHLQHLYCPLGMSSVQNATW